MKNLLFHHDGVPSHTSLKVMDNRLRFQLVGKSLYSLVIFKNKSNLFGTTSFPVLSPPLRYDFCTTLWLLRLLFVAKCQTVALVGSDLDQLRRSRIVLQKENRLVYKSLVFAAHEVFKWLILMYTDRFNT